MKNENSHLNGAYFHLMMMVSTIFFFKYNKYIQNNVKTIVMFTYKECGFHFSHNYKYTQKTFLQTKPQNRPNLLYICVNNNKSI